jgi:hypothetical protein
MFINNNEDEFGYQLGNLNTLHTNGELLSKINEINDMNKYKFL